MGDLANSVVRDAIIFRFYMQFKNASNPLMGAPVISFSGTKIKGGKWTVSKFFLLSVAYTAGAHYKRYYLGLTFRSSGDNTYPS